MIKVNPYNPYITNSNYKTKPQQVSFAGDVRHVWAIGESLWSIAADAASRISLRMDNIDKDKNPKIIASLYREIVKSLRDHPSLTPRQIIEAFEVTAQKLDTTDTTNKVGINVVDIVASQCKNITKVLKATPNLSTTEIARGFEEAAQKLDALG